MYSSVFKVLQKNLSTKQLAEKFSATALVNSLLREWDGFEIEDNEIVFRNKHKALSIALENYSRVGSHAYKNIFYRTTEGRKETLSFEIFTQELFQIINKEDRFHMLYPRIIESNRSLAEILLYRKHDYDVLLKKKRLSFIDAEQALILGHNFHPCPKSKVEFKSHDHRLFAPEFCGSFSLKWVLLKKEYFFQDNSNCFKDKRWCADLFEQDHNSEFDNLYTPFPFHPWQFNKLKKNEKITFSSRFNRSIFNRLRYCRVRWRS